MQPKNTAMNLFRPIRSAVRVFALSLIASAVTLSVAKADDTEIFFSQAEGDTSTYPNIVFILDNSGSMNGNIAGGTQSKLQAMKDAMNIIIDSVENINMGMVNFLGSTDDYRSEMVYPVTSVSEPGARDAMKAVVNNMVGNRATPLVGALYESAMIMRGGNIEETSASYTSPMVGECQNNHIVMLSDGQAWRNEAVPKTEALIGGSCALASSSNRDRFEQCGRELSQWLYNTDHSSSLSNEQNISVSTIGFNISSTFLDDVASAGGGEYYEANRADELVDVFNEIITSVKDIDTTFVAPATSISQFNRLTQSNDLYFGLFKPGSSTTWSGNLKRYQLGVDSGSIVIADANGDPAVDPDTGFFKETAQSFWSTSADGSSVEAGGAAGTMVSSNRTVYTHLGSIPTTGTTLNDVFAPGNTTINTYLAGLPSDVQEMVVEWVKGKDVKDEIASSTERQHMGDVLHSAPVTVNYESGQSLVYVGTNEGFLHAIDRGDGTEHFSFIPEELIPNLVEFYMDTGAVDRPYGIDGDITLRHNDINGNSVVDGADEVFLYFGLRRGGDDYYALDVTDPDAPRLMWRLDGGTGDYALLGQSWSKPVPTKIQFYGAEKDVLIFGGGYDINQDPSATGSSLPDNNSDSVGNTLFIVDAEDGDLLWSARSNMPNAGDMDFSFPGDLRIIDIDGDTFADRIYAGDMGGQLWRFDLKSYHQGSHGLSGLVAGGVMADLNGSGGTGLPVRFYNEPDVALMTHEGMRFMSVSIGSGWRAHPLDEDIEDMFYMIRDNSPLVTPDGYGKNSGGSWRPVVPSDLTDVSDSLSTERTAPTNTDGWKLKLAESGEKNLSRSITINNQVIFTTYAPTAATDVCSPPSGQGFIYALDGINGDPVLPLDSGSGGGSSSLTKGDRRKILATESIPAAPTAAIADVGGEIQTTVIIGAEMPLEDLLFSDLTKRTYWQDMRRGSTTPAACRAAAGSAMCR